MIVFTVKVMFAILNCCGQNLLYANFANKIYHISLKFLLEMYNRDVDVSN